MISWITVKKAQIAAWKAMGYDPKDMFVMLNDELPEVEYYNELMAEYMAQQSERQAAQHAHA